MTDPTPATEAGRILTRLETSAKANHGYNISVPADDITEALAQARATAESQRDALVGKSAALLSKDSFKRDIRRDPVMQALRDLLANLAPLAAARDAAIAEKVVGKVLDWGAFKDWEFKAAAQGCGATEEQMDGAALFYTWASDQLKRSDARQRLDYMADEDLANALHRWLHGVTTTCRMCERGAAAILDYLNSNEPKEETK